MSSGEVSDMAIPSAHLLSVPTPSLTSLITKLKSERIPYMVSGKAHKAERSSDEYSTSGARFQFCTTMASADETEAARALLAAKDFSNLAAMLVPDGVPSEFLIDELSFELVAPILTHHAAAPAATTRCMQALATAANPREAYALLMEAFSTHPSAPCQLLVLGALPAVLRRITRKRSEFVAACLGSLSRRFVAAWPGQEWDDEAEDEGAPPPPPSRRLLDALVACVPTPAELAEGDRSRLRGDERLCVGFLLRLLAVAARHATPEAEAGVAEALDARTVSAAELGEAAAAAARASAEGAAAAADSDAGDDDGAAAELARWDPTGAALYLHAVVAAARTAPADATLDATASSGRAALRAEASALDGAARLALGCALGAPLLQGRGGLARRGHALVAWGVAAAGGDSSAGSTVVVEGEAAATASAAVRALLAHMASDPDAAERSAAYKTLQAALGVWAPAARFAELRALLRGCPFPNAAALLLHRLKEEHVRERGDGSGDGGGGGGAFGGAAVAELAEEVLEVQGEADPSRCLDALVGALNLLRFVLAAPGEGIGAERVAKLRRDTLAPLDLRLRRHMDELHRLASEAERQTPPPPTLDDMRMDFTRCHMAVDVVTRVLELCEPK